MGYIRLKTGPLADDLRKIGGILIRAADEIEHLGDVAENEAAADPRKITAPRAVRCACAAKRPT